MEPKGKTRCGIFGGSIQEIGKSQKIEQKIRKNVKDIKGRGGSKGTGKKRLCKRTTGE